MLWLWAFSFLAQVLVLTLLFLRGNFRKLPLFSAYVALNICQAGFLVFVYSHPWSDPATPGALAWTSELTTLIAQALATTEILEITLRPYQGIWGLAWRALTVTSGVVVLLVALADRGHSGRSSLVPTRSRLSSHFCHGSHRLLAPGPLLFHFGPTGLQNDTRRILFLFLHANSGQYLSSSILFYRELRCPPGSVASLEHVFVCGRAGHLGGRPRKPFPVEDRQVASSSDAVYQRFSPEINEQTCACSNERLLRLWKMEARSH